MSGINFRGGRSLPSILQTEHSECALACLAMASGYFGHKIDIITLRNRHSVSQHGVTLKDVIRIAERMNLASRAVRLELEELGKLKCPAILHWSMNHFVVLKKVSSGKLVIHDPAVGIRTVSLKDAGENFTGIALELTPTSDFKEKDEEKKLGISQLWTRATGLKRGIIQVLLLSLLLALFVVAMPYLTQLVIDDVLVSRDRDLLKIVIIAYLLVVLIQLIAGGIRSFAVMHLTNRMGFQFAVNVYRHLLKLPLEYFSKRHIGDIVSRFGSQASIREFLTSGIVSAALDGIMAAATLVMMLIYSRQLTLIILAAVVLYGVVRLSTFGWIRRRTEEQIVAAAKENTNFMENIRTMQGIKLFGKETDRLSLWENYYVDVINTGIVVQKFGIHIGIINGIITNGRAVLILYLGAIAVLGNELSIGMLMAFTSWSQSFLARALGLLDKAIEFRLLDVHLTRLADIAFTNVEPHVDGAGLPSVENSSVPLFEVRDVAFRYSENHPFLFNSVNLSLKSGETIAVIGPSGCGKSTLLKVLASLYQPSHGEIRMYDMEIGKAGLQNYRSGIGAVMQDDGLLTGSISDNICFYDPRPDKEAIERAANLAAIHKDIVAMPMQYDTLVGNLGVALSGGQIQRILLARAIYKNPKILFLDEATSHLDVENERLVNDAVKRLKMGRVIVAHRPETIKLADQVFQLTPGGLIPVVPDQLDLYEGDVYE
ncbi:MAG: peptidase domain-containing ABC transporter [Acidobacteriota bacterium]|jgi:ATP-binding cassette subfamily B protein RaxB|nr:peptidase domain-containing ABC transporter [Acidobacteriota bacterium]